MNFQHTLARKSCRVLYVAYPLLPVSEHSPGGAEQILWTLEREMNARGIRTTTAACAGSQLAGQLFATGDPAESMDQFENRSQQQTRAVIDWLRSGTETEFDLLHDMSGWFWRNAENIHLPVLATLHLARALYKQINFSEIPQNVFFNCVSQTQTAEFQDLDSRIVGVARNGIALERFPKDLVPQEKREYLLWLGRICEEKGTHTALDVAHAARRKIVIAGAVYPFLYHQRYFAREVIPRLKRAGSMARYVEKPTFLEKIDLIRNAQALLLTSNIGETSSVVAMEAAACGTPVVAFPQGALTEIVAAGVTGLFADDSKQMVDAISSIDQIACEDCRKHAEKYYSATAMADRYEELYGVVLHKVTEEKQAAGS